MPRYVKESDSEVESKEVGRKTRMSTNSVLDSPLRRSSRIKQPAMQNDSMSESSETSVRNTRRRTYGLDTTMPDLMRHTRTRRNSAASDISEQTENDSATESSKRTTRRTIASLSTVETPTQAQTRLRRATRAGSETSTPPVGRVTRRTRASSMEPEVMEESIIQHIDTPMKSKRRASAVPSEPVVTEESEELRIEKTVPELDEDEAQLNDSKSSRRKSKGEVNDEEMAMEVDDSPDLESEVHALEKLIRDNIETPSPSCNSNVSEMLDEVLPRRRSVSSSVKLTNDKTDFPQQSGGESTSPEKSSSISRDENSETLQEKEPVNVPESDAARKDFAVDSNCVVVIEQIDVKKITGVTTSFNDIDSNAIINSHLLQESTLIESDLKENDKECVEEDKNTVNKENLLEEEKNTVNTEKLPEEEKNIISTENLLEEEKKCVEENVNLQTKITLEGDEDFVDVENSFEEEKNSVEVESSLVKCNASEVREECLKSIVNEEIIDVESLDTEKSNFLENKDECEIQIVDISDAETVTDVREYFEKQTLPSVDDENEKDDVVISPDEYFEKQTLPSIDNENEKDDVIISPDELSSIQIICDTTADEESSKKLEKLEIDIEITEIQTEQTKSPVHEKNDSSSREEIISIENLKVINRRNSVDAKSPKRSESTDNEIICEMVNVRKSSIVTEYRSRTAEESSHKSEVEKPTLVNGKSPKKKSQEKPVSGETENHTVSDSESESNFCPSFKDIPAEEWTGHEENEDTNAQDDSIHSLSTERNESECEIALVDKEPEQNKKTKSDLNTSKKSKDVDREKMIEDAINEESPMEVEGEVIEDEKPLSPSKSPTKNRLSLNNSNHEINESYTKNSERKSLSTADENNKSLSVIEHNESTNSETNRSRKSIEKLSRRHSTSSNKNEILNGDDAEARIKSLDVSTKSNNVSMSEKRKSLNESLDSSPQKPSDSSKENIDINNSDNETDENDTSLTTALQNSSFNVIQDTVNKLLSKRKSTDKNKSIIEETHDQENDVAKESKKLNESSKSLKSRRSRNSRNNSRVEIESSDSESTEEKSMQMLNKSSKSQSGRRSSMAKNTSSVAENPDSESEFDLIIPSKRVSLNASKKKTKNADSDSEDEKLDRSKTEKRKSIKDESIKNHSPIELVESESDGGSESSANISHLFELDNENDDASLNSVDQDVANDMNLAGDSITRYSDDDVPADDCMATESESEDSDDDDGEDLKDFVVDDDEELEDEELEDEEEDVSEEKTKKRRKRIIEEAESDSNEEIEEIDEENEENEEDQEIPQDSEEEENSPMEKSEKSNSVTSSPLKSVTPKNRKSDISTDVGSEKLEDVATKLSSKKLKDQTMDSSTPKLIKNVLSVKFDSAKSNRSLKLESSMNRSDKLKSKLDKSTTETPEKLSRSLKESVTPLNENSLLQSSFQTAESAKSSLQTSFRTAESLKSPFQTVESDSPQKTPSSLPKSKKSEILSQTLIMPATDSPEVRFLMKEKLNDSLPALKLQRRSKDFRRSISDAARQLEVIEDFELEEEKTLTSSVKTTEAENETMESEKKKKKRKKKKSEKKLDSGESMEIQAESTIEQESLEEPKKKSKKSKKKSNSELVIIEPSVEEIEELPKKSKKRKQQVKEETVEIPETTEKKKKKKKKTEEISMTKLSTLPESSSATESEYAPKKSKKNKKKKLQENSENVQRTKTSIKRLPDDLLDSLTEIAERPKKRRRVVKEEKEMPKEAYNFKGERLKDIDSKNFISLSSFGATTQFEVVDLERAKKKPKKSVAAKSFRERMLARNPRQPVSAYLMYQQKRKASGKDNY